MAISKKKQLKKCGNKRSYETIEEAKKAAACMARRKIKEGKPVITILRAYGCHCGKFHYGRTKELNWDLISNSGSD